MPNEQTSVPLFASGEVLTAANMNLSAGTGVPVFTNTTTRDAAFGGANEKVLAEGQLCYLSSTNVVQYYDGAAWATVGPATAGALVLVKTQTVGSAVASVSVTDAFSTTYDNYKIIYTGGVGSAGADLQMILGATTAGYFFSLGYIPWAAGIASITVNNGASFAYIGGASTKFAFISCDIYRPFATDETAVSVLGANDSNGQFGGGYLNNSTSYTGFTITPSGGTLTGGTIYVYGYAKA